MLLDRLDDTPLVSIIVPAYGVEEYLARCLDSILAQTYKSYEVVIVDDASPDGTGRIADEYCRTHHSMRVIHQEINLGTNYARQAGLQLCDGSLIAFVDGDDILLPGYLEELVYLVRTYNADISVCAQQLISNVDDVESVTCSNIASIYQRDEALYYVLTHDLYWPHPMATLNNVCNKIYTRSIVDQLDWDSCDYSIGEDDFCAVRLLSYASSIVVSEKALYCCYKSNPQSKTLNKHMPFLFQGKPYSAFKMCRDFYLMLQTVVDVELNNEIRYRAYIMYKYYVWSLVEKKHSLSVQDVQEFDEFFPLEAIEGITKHEVNQDFLEVLREQGLMGWVNHCSALRESELLDQTATIAYLEADRARTLSIKGAARRLLGNIRRRINRDIQSIRQKKKDRRNNKPTIKAEQVYTQLLSTVKSAYDTQTTRVPKIIHYCWMGGKEKPDEIKRYLETWKKQLPDYVIIEWNESNFNLHCNRYVREAYENKKWAFVSDVVRLHALYHFGGVYVDADVEIRKPLDRFLDHRAFSSFEVPEDEFVAPMIPTGLMASERRGQWVKELLDAYESRVFILPDGSFDLITNLEPITRHTVEKYGLVRNGEFQDLGAITIYPSDYFCAKSWKTGEVTITENTFSIHHFTGSWL